MGIICNSFNDKIVYFFAGALAETAPGSFFSTDLIIPTAIVCLISLMANLPNGGYSVKVSTTIGFFGSKVTKAESPDLMAFGFSSTTFPERLSILESIFKNLQEM